MGAFQYNLIVENTILFYPGYEMLGLHRKIPECPMSHPNILFP